MRWIEGLFREKVFDVTRDVIKTLIVATPHSPTYLGLLNTFTSPADHDGSAMLLIE